METELTILTELIEFRIYILCLGGLILAYESSKIPLGSTANSLITMAWARASMLGHRVPLALWYPWLTTTPNGDSKLCITILIALGLGRFPPTPSGADAFDPEGLFRHKTVNKLCDWRNSSWYPQSEFLQLSLGLNLEQSFIPKSCSY